MEPRWTRLGRDELFDRLEGRAAAGTTVITPNRRLAEALAEAFDRRQQEAGRCAWEAPDILPWQAFVARCHDDAAHADAAPAPPQLLTADEEQLLWEDAIRAGAWRERLLSIPATAALAAEAWRTVHEWRIEGALDGWPGNEDSEAFRSWRTHYVRRTEREGWTDAARLPGLVETLLARGQLAAPRTVVLYGFDLVTPQQRDLAAALRQAGASLFACGPDPIEGTVRRTELESPRVELEHAARWARARLESAARGTLPRIGIVVPDLASRRAEVARVFDRMLPPGLFNVSLGEPLASAPLADAALAILELCGGAIAFERASRLLRSPFVAGAEREMTARAALDAALRRVAPAMVTATRLRTLMADLSARRAAPECPALREALDRMMAASSGAGRAAPHEWARRFTAWLEAAGFPGERGLDSAEFQTLAKWRESLATLATLASVAPAWNAHEARSRLQRLCRETLFQPASGQAPVQLLGILESSRLTFDHLWVSGLTEEAWPVPARPQPLIPPSLQRKAGIPQATPERSLEVDRALTHAWRGAAAEVIFSSARAEGDRELLPSPLVATIALTPSAELGIPPIAARREALFEAGQRPGASSFVPEGAPPAVALDGVRGGTAILADQAACPFRAFAHFRLAASALERPEAGLTPPERGQLLHALMAHVWETLRDQRTLLARSAEELAALVEASASHAVSRMRAERPGRLEGELAALERERLAAVALEWLALERERPAFEVTKREERVALAAGPLRLHGRVDRVDRLEGGGLAILDYKTGAASVGAWLGERPEDLQLPLYAMAAGDEEVHAVAFARVRRGQSGFAGLAREAGLLPKVPAVQEHRRAKTLARTWAELVAQWRGQADRLGHGFAQGEAAIDPKTGLATCQRCDLQALCRVHERLRPVDEDAEPEAPE